MLPFRTGSTCACTCVTARETSAQALPPNQAIYVAACRAVEVGKRVAGGLAARPEAVARVLAAAAATVLVALLGLISPLKRLQRQS